MQKCTQHFQVSGVFNRKSLSFTECNLQTVSDNSCFMLPTAAKNVNFNLGIIYYCYSVIVTLTGLDRENVKADPNTNTNQVVSTISESVSEVSERWSLDI